MTDKDTIVTKSHTPQTHWFDHFLPCYLAAFMLISLAVFTACATDMVACVWERRFASEPKAVEPDRPSPVAEVP